MNNDIYSACFTLVQLGDDLVITGHYAVASGERRTVRDVDYRLPAETDATDLTMWAQMAAARLCDAL